MGERPPRSASQPAQLHRQLAASPRSSPRGASQPAQSRWPPASFASSSPCIISQPAQAQSAEVHTAILTWAWNGDEHRVDLTKVPRGDWSTALSRAALELTNDPSEHFCTCVKEMADGVGRRRDYGLPLHHLVPHSSDRCLQICLRGRSMGMSSWWHDPLPGEHAQVYSLWSARVDMLAMRWG